jgi:sortase A
VTAPAAVPRGGRAAARRQAARRRREWRKILAVRVFGEALITLGVVMLLFVVYQLWWTNVRADSYARGTTSTLEKQWSGDASQAQHPAYPKTFAPGTKFAIIYIPKLDVKTPVAEGTDKESILDNGLVGHYDGAQETAFPWSGDGNFALAGHRNTHGEPFRYINRLQPGDKVVVETAYDWYTYVVTRTLAQTSPSDVSVIAPVPPESGFTKPGKYITLTTCTPEFTSKYRMAVWGELVEDLPKSSGRQPAALGG